MFTQCDDAATQSSKKHKTSPEGRNTRKKSLKADRLFTTLDRLILPSIKSTPESTADSESLPPIVSPFGEYPGLAMPKSTNYNKNANTIELGGSFADVDTLT